MEYLLRKIMKWQVKGKKIGIEKSAKIKNFYINIAFLSFKSINIVVIFEHWLLEIPTLLIFSFLIKFTN